MIFCSECGKSLEDTTKFCSECGTTVIRSAILERPEIPSENSREINSGFGNEELIRFSEYYQKEFAQMSNSNEGYKGKWNWCAFLFGIFWSFSKGLWLTSIIQIVVVCFLMPTVFGPLIFSIVVGILRGLRGNYMYYNYAIYKSINVLHSYA